VKRKAKNTTVDKKTDTYPAPKESLASQRQADKDLGFQEAVEDSCRQVVDCSSNILGKGKRQRKPMKRFDL
jgi:hypothetical protein